MGPDNEPLHDRVVTAIKILPPELAFDPAIRARFTREPQTSAHLAPPRPASSRCAAPITGHSSLFPAPMSRKRGRLRLVVPAPITARHTDRSER